MNVQMKKGDLIQRRQDIPKGKSLMHGFSSLEKAQAALSTIHQFYRLPKGVLIEAGFDDLNPGQFAVLALEDTYIMIDAKVNWVVDYEVGITYDNGSSAILDMNEEENSGWIVVKSAVPTYQSDVEHMSDEELRASIDALRMQRISTPVKARRRTASTPKEPTMSAQDKALMKMLNGMSPEQQLALKQKLGLV